jgi:hypothetical protein
LGRWIKSLSVNANSILKNVTQDLGLKGFSETATMGYYDYTESKSKQISKVYVDIGGVQEVQWGESEK